MTCKSRCYLKIQPIRILHTRYHSIGKDRIKSITVCQTSYVSYGRSLHCSLTSLPKSSPTSLPKLSCHIYKTRDFISYISSRRGRCRGTPCGDTYPLPGEKLPEVLSSDAPLKTAPQGGGFCSAKFQVRAGTSACVRIQDVPHYRP